MGRSQCKECPWSKLNETRHNLKFRNSVSKMLRIGHKSHACHMISGNIWDKESQNDNKICIGFRDRRAE